MTYYKNCTAAYTQGVSDIPRGSDGYRAPLDRDNDGVACETADAPAGFVPADGFSYKSPDRLQDYPQHQQATVAGGQLPVTGPAADASVAGGALIVVGAVAYFATRRRRSFVS